MFRYAAMSLFIVFNSMFSVTAFTFSFAALFSAFTSLFVIVLLKCYLFTMILTETISK